MTAPLQFWLEFASTYSYPVAMRFERVAADAATWLARAQEPAVKDRLRAQTETAEALGIFGAPSFVAGDELFWVSDPVEHAPDWACRRAG